MLPEAPPLPPPPVVEFDGPWPALFVMPPPVQEGEVSPFVLMTGIPVGTARTEADEMRRRTEMKNFILVESRVLGICARESCEEMNTVLLRCITNRDAKTGRQDQQRREEGYGSWPQSESSNGELDEHH